MRAAGYIRVSTQEQVQHGWNLGEDRRLIEERCQAQGWELVDIFDDGGLQGDDPNRPELMRLLASLDDFDVLIVRSQDRLSRDLAIWTAAANALRLAGVQVETFTGPLDLVTPQGEFVANMMAVVGKLEKWQTGQRVEQALRARAAAGEHTGGAAPFGYRWTGDRTLVIEPSQAEVVKRIFTDYLNGVSQKALVRSLAETNAGGKRWYQSAVSRILSNGFYTGRLEFKGETYAGRHEAIITQETFDRAKQIRESGLRRKGGCHPDGAHLLTKGMLRCRCGSAMIPRKERLGVERERYVCSGRNADKGSCDQPSIRRELIDGPFLEHLLDGYIDIEATRQRVGERMDSALTISREALAHAEAEVARIERALAATERDYDNDEITARQYNARETRLTEELAGARNALQRAQGHVQGIEQAGPVGDAEQVLLAHLASLKRAVTAGVDAAPDLAALRNVIGQMFQSVVLVRRGEFPRVNGELGFIPFEGDVPDPPDIADGYWLLLTLRSSAVDAETFKPIGQEMPVPEWQSYPDGFLCRYCWWYSSA